MFRGDPEVPTVQTINSLPQAILTIPELLKPRVLIVEALGPSGLCKGTLLGSSRPGQLFASGKIRGLTPVRFNCEVHFGVFEVSDTTIVVGARARTIGNH